ncbi:jg7930 [Pararge aegeria aegeria]|uniref:Jg7930 protein n=1 Tax=Pararge aegeria aegeria TaxID=348720 RepID=A0A8S4R2Z9_9NEOP|nr:jg7930 [Pararge aegeria aegeria]
MCIPLSRCCFCVSLDVGSKIISIVNLTSSVMIAMVYGSAAMLPAPVAESRKIVYAIIASGAMFQLLIGCLLIYGVFGVSVDSPVGAEFGSQNLPQAFLS